ncbi:hypothetical protein G7Y89_g6697 [Cudoniella acicularis]|uniref:Uncharacterized protein n=1 Tax=Cudoniella acicularis TaxID=354080 RepID=A0A8H4W2S2_9HELO|nr:hypothetical protein G7Y89_g6697 [Cudoniella acicularis]
MSPKKSSLKLGESWVVEGDDYESPETSPPDNEDEPVRLSPRRRTRGSYRTGKSPEPKFVMPSIDVNSLDGSWTENSSRTAKHQTGNRYSERLPDTRRRVLNNSSPEKRNRTSTTSKHKGTPTPSISLFSSLEDSDPLQNFLGLALYHASNMLLWLFDVLRGSLRILKIPISYMLAVWLLFGLGFMVTNLVTNSLYASLSPICRIPGAALIGLPFCTRYVGPDQPPPPVKFDQLMAVQSNFEQVLEESAGGASLPLYMKRGEASIRDLRQLVRYSHLHSKDELVLEFDGFIETARIASYDLQKFNSHVGRAVDNVISTTRWTSRVLDGIQHDGKIRGTISAFIHANIISPFQPVKFTEKILLDTYIQHTRSVEEQIFKLIDEAQALLMILNNLEDRLDVINGVATREGIRAQSEKDEILASLWGKVGGYKDKKNKTDRQLALLNQLGTYRKKAYAHVSGTVLRLQAMGAGLEDLRERVGSPELLRDVADVPLSVHIENIQRGVERLEEQRQSVLKATLDSLSLRVFLLTDRIIFATPETMSTFIPRAATTSVSSSSAPSSEGVSFEEVQIVPDKERAIKWRNFRGELRKLFKVGRRWSARRGKRPERRKPSKDTTSKNTTRGDTTRKESQGTEGVKIVGPVGARRKPIILCETCWVSTSGSGGLPTSRPSRSTHSPNCPTPVVENFDWTQLKKRDSGYEYSVKTGRGSNSSPAVKVDGNRESSDSGGSKDPRRVFRNMVILAVMMFGKERKVDHGWLPEEHGGFLKKVMRNRSFHLNFQSLPKDNQLNDVPFQLLCPLRYFFPLTTLEPTKNGYRITMVIPPEEKQTTTSKPLISTSTRPSKRNATLKKFHLFANLPPEIRLMI